MGSCPSRQFLLRGRAPPVAQNPPEHTATAAAAAAAATVVVVIVVVVVALVVVAAAARAAATRAAATRKRTSRTEQSEHTERGDGQTGGAHNPCFAACASRMPKRDELRAKSTVLRGCLW